MTFHIAGGTAASLTPIIVELVLAGAISEERSAGYLYNLKMFTAGSSGGHVGWTTQFYDSPTDARNYVGWAVAGGAGEPNGWQSWELLAGTATHKHFRGVLLVPGAQKGTSSKRPSACTVPAAWPATSAIRRACASICRKASASPVVPGSC